MRRVLIFFIIIFFICPRLSGKDIKVISLAPSLTEILFAIGLGENEIVGVTDYCNYPKEANKILRVGSLITVNLEKIISLEPDYVFSIGNKNSPLNTRLKKAGLKIIVLDPQNLDDIFSSILTIGQTLHREKEAKEVIDRMKKRLDDIKNKTEKIKYKKRVYVEIWDDPITSCGKNSLVNEVITKAGGINITGKIDNLYPAVSQEFIIEKNPDIIILGYMSRNQKNAVLNRFGWQDINAIKTRNVIPDIDPNLFLRAGPRIVDGIEQIYKKIYENR